MNDILQIGLQAERGENLRTIRQFKDRFCPMHVWLRSEERLTVPRLRNGEPQHIAVAAGEYTGIGEACPQVEGNLVAIAAGVADLPNIPSPCEESDSRHTVISPSAYMPLLWERSWLLTSLKSVSWYQAPTATL